MKPVTNAQVRKLMQEMTHHGRIGHAAMKAGMDRKTARKYIAAGTLPSAMTTPRTWRTRDDPFAAHWPLIVERLTETPLLDAKTLFDWLVETHPTQYEPGQLRTLQRHVRQWRAEHGPDKRVFFAQAHRPGEAMQTDFTHATQSAVTIAGQLLVHLLCVVVLPYSNWQWATLCASESMAALRKGLQRALFQLGRRPRYHQTDNSTAATHRIPDGKMVLLEGGKRPFNEDYLALMRHFGLEPRTTEVGAKEQNGDVEASNGALKRALEQALLLRGSRDFASAEEWQDFIDKTVRKRNDGRGQRLLDELEAMRPVEVAALSEFTDDDVLVSEWSTIRVDRCAYSVPSRLMHEWVRVRLFEDRLEVWFAGKLQLRCERLRGRNRHRVDYRHIIWSLVQKPGAFARYVYREEMFPTLVFRRAYDAIHTPHQGVRGDVQYLRILHLAATHLEADVERVLAQMLADGITPHVEAIRPSVSTPDHAPPPVLEVAQVDLHDYDALLEGVGT